VPFTTAGHGTGYDIVGQGIARPDSMINAFKICCDMAASRAQAARAGAA
jgi:4-hydroxy-L-threonine phosphate dehydrogenase PdxA